jgi:pepF/M3 family oligoendopeptidase
MAVNTLPHWDMSMVYPGLESAEFERGLREATRSIDELVQFFDDRSIGHRQPTPLDDATLQTLETVLEHFNGVLEEVGTLRAYIQSFVSTDSRNTRAHAKLSELEQALAKLSLLRTRLTAWIGSLDVEEAVERSGLAREHAFVLRKSKQQAAHLMSSDEEALAAELDLSSRIAWEKLYGTFSSQLTVDVKLKGRRQTLPMSAVRNLAYDPNREVRQSAYEAELAAWERAAVPIAAALNSIKGQVNTLSKRRHWDSPLEAALFQSNIDRQTLDAMMEAAQESFPDFRHYLHVKARALKISMLAWYDLFAPVGTERRQWTFKEAEEFIADQFDRYSSKLRSLAERAFRERWIDAEPRSGKRDGAFCMWLRRDESRILSNYKPSYNGVSTLAHELGHAYHNLDLAGRRPLQRQTPMTLAETASTFCETIVRYAALQDAGLQEQLAILEASLQGACQIVVDISSRFLFERAVFDRRRERELSVDELKSLMLDAQQQTYGDGLGSELLHPFMWAAKPHYYNSTFYNFPYMFGLLFGLGLYARYQEDPDAFKANYDELLSSTGLYDAAELAKRFRIDLRAKGFWRASLGVIREDIKRFESLIAQQ